MSKPQTKLHQGRCVAQLDKTRVGIQTERGTEEVSFDPAQSAAFAVGDIIAVQGQALRVLTPNRTETKTQVWKKRVLDPRRLHGQKVRRQVEAGIREFFNSQGFLETRTPTLVQCPGMETHIRPFAVKEGGYLPTSPEFAMKRLLVGGLEKIYQICPSFRYEPTSPHHHPEFTMLEWYRAYAGYEEIMADMEQMVERLAIDILGKPVLQYQGQEISVKTPWPRLTVRELFQSIVQVDLIKSSDVASMRREVERLGLKWNAEDTWDDLYFRIWLNHIEPALPKDRAVFVTRYPASQSALAVIDQDPDGSRWARRFEPYAGGLELGNAFEELTDPVEQRKRFVEDMNLREQIYGPSFPKNPIDEEFLHALTEGMPPSGGIAVGVDRLIMLLADEPDIDYTIWLPSYFLNESK